MSDKMNLSEPEKLVLKLGNGGGRNIQSDHAQNDPTKPDYIKNRIAYYCRKFEDIEKVEYPEPVFGMVTGDMDGQVVSEPLFFKIAEIPGNATPIEIVEELIGLGFQGEEMRLDDPEMVPPEYQQYIKREEIFDENGQSVAAYFEFESPFVVVVNKDNFDYTYVYKYEEDGEIYEGDPYPMHFPEKGIYSIIQDYDADNNVYYTFDKILFREVKPMDKELLPPELLKPQIKLDNYPQLDSDNAITSGAVYSLKTTHEKRMVQIENNHNSLSSTVSGHTTSITNLNTAVSKKMPDIPVTTTDNGKIPMVVNGSWTAVKIPFAEEGAY